MLVARRTPRSSAPLPRAALFSVALALLAAPAAARADVEARCPAGFTTLPSPGSGDGERPVVGCLRPPMQLAASELANAIAPGSPEEQQIAAGLAQQLARAGNVTAAPFRAETIAGRPARVSDVSGTGVDEAGQNTRVEGTIVLLPAGRGMVVAMGFSQDAARGNARQAVRALVPTIAGLDGTPNPARVSASCPPGLAPQTAAPTGPGGMRRVVMCSEGERGARRVDVLESRLPARAPADARPQAEALAGAINRQLAALGGRAAAGATQPITLGPNLSGFATPVHGEASGPGGQSLVFDGLVVTLPTTAGGHAQIMATAQGSTPEAVRATVQTLATAHLRLDGTPAPGAAPPGAAATAAAGDGGASASQPPPRPREVDPSRPIWTPTDEEAGRPARGAANAAQTPSAEESESARTGRYVMYGLLAGAALFIAYLVRRR